MDPVTLIGIVAVAVMFLAGVTLVGMGLRRHPDRLPQGADAILDAVARGDLAAPPARTLDLRTQPKLTKRAAATATAKPLPEILAEREPIAAPDLVHPPASPPRVESATPAVRLVPRPAAGGTTVVAERTATDPVAPIVPRSTPDPATSAAAREIVQAAQIVEPSAETASEGDGAVTAPDSTALFVADLNRALFEESDDTESDEARSFLDAEPKLQRF